MRKTVLAAAVGLLAGSGLAFAQQAPSIHDAHLDQVDTDNDDGVSLAEYQSFMTSSFARLDSNGDSVLVQSEVTSVLTPEQFSTVDANKDARVSRDEFMNQVMRDFAAADRSGDGNLK